MSLIYVIEVTQLILNLWYGMYIPDSVEDFVHGQVWDPTVNHFPGSFVRTGFASQPPSSPAPLDNLQGLQSSLVVQHTAALSATYLEQGSFWTSPNLDTESSASCPIVAVSQELLDGFQDCPEDIDWQAGPKDALYQTSARRVERRRPDVRFQCELLLSE